MVVIAIFCIGKHMEGELVSFSYKEIFLWYYILEEHLPCGNKQIHILVFLLVSKATLRAILDASHV